MVPFLPNFNSSNSVCSISLRNHFRERGSQLFPENGAHCTFALMLVNGKVLVEDRRDKGAKKASPWAEPLVLTAQPMVQLEEEEFVCQRWINTAAGVKLHEARR